MRQPLPRPGEQEILRHQRRDLSLDIRHHLGKGLEAAGLLCNSACSAITWPARRMNSCATKVMRGLASRQRCSNAPRRRAAADQAGACQGRGDQLLLELGLGAEGNELQRQLADARQAFDGLHLIL